MLDFDLPEFCETQDANAIVRQFAANPAFRAAEQHELVTEDNPFRRPVRPDDLSWLDYGAVMSKPDALKLSGLLGHRMLRNAYDADLLYLPPTASAAATVDEASFYSTRGRIHSALVKPVLERHLFTFLRDEREPLPGPELSGLKAQLQEYYLRRIAEPSAAYRAATSARHRGEAATFALLQYTAFTPAMNAAVARGGLGEYQLAHPQLRPILLRNDLRWSEEATRYDEMLSNAGLTSTASAYWQFFLSSSLARGNYLSFLAGNHELIFSFLGAFLHKLIDEEVAREPFGEMVAEALQPQVDYFRRPATLSVDSVAELVDVLVAPLVHRFGPHVVTQVYGGFSDAAWLERLWDRDLAEQLTWADRISEYQDKADKLDHYLTTERIKVDLDTFVESCEETSTTHVHNEHRLVMIEKGQMHFWNNVTHKIELNTGDKILIPMSRLHGSTVLSGECTYHQPIIPEELLRHAG